MIMSPNVSSNAHPGHHDFTATIAASACVDLASPSDTADDSIGGGIVPAPHVIHAVSVSQPMQTWTVIRDHVDFMAMDGALKDLEAGLPRCPGLPVADQSVNDGNIDVNFIVQARNSAQDWLSAALTFPAVRNSVIMRQFLCYGANIVPPQFEGVGWVNFNLGDAQLVRQQQQSPQHPAPASYAAAVRGCSSSPSNNNVDEMEMDDMFAFEHEDNDDNTNADSVEDDDGDRIGGDDDASYLQGRYEPTEEALSPAEVMEIQQDYKEVEMVEDVGSLAQSLGASHLGRSLNLQKEMMSYKKGQQMMHQQIQQQQGGLTIGLNIATNHCDRIIPGVASSPGGIGSAMAKASSQEQPQAQAEPLIPGLGDSFYRTTPVSAPKLDSFKMVKVIGKGSFGKLTFVFSVDLLSFLEIRMGPYVSSCFRQSLPRKRKADQCNVCPQSLKERQHHQAQPSRAHQN